MNLFVFIYLFIRTYINMAGPSRVFVDPMINGTRYFYSVCVMYCEKERGKKPEVRSEEKMSKKVQLVARRTQLQQCERREEEIF